MNNVLQIRFPSEGGINPPAKAENTAEPADQGVKRNLSEQSESSSSVEADMKKPKLESGNTGNPGNNPGNNTGKTGNNPGNPDIGSVFASQTWEAYFATWDCRRKARGILARSDKLGASQPGSITTNDVTYRARLKGGPQVA